MAIGFLAELRQSILQACRELWLLSEEAAFSGNVFADGFWKGNLREPIKEPSKLSRPQAGDSGKEGTRGDAGFPFPLGLVIGNGQGILQLGLKAGPESMEEVLIPSCRDSLPSGLAESAVIAAGEGNRSPRFGMTAGPQPPAGGLAWENTGVPGRVGRVGRLGGCPVRLTADAPSAGPC